MIKLKKGILIVFEGIDGAGKTTQAKLLCERLKDADFEVVLSKEPTDGAWGQKVKKLLEQGRNRVSPQEELEWFIKDRQEHVANIIIPGLEQKKIVILDRYYLSTVAYQGSLGINPEEIERKNFAFAPQPNLLFLIEITPQVGIQRIKENRNNKVDFFEREHYLSKVNKIFVSFDKPFIHRLPGNETIPKIASQVWDITMRHLRERDLIER